ncbi:hypothetical protein ACUHMQ_10710 [Chitinimonas sp. PSY-7]
MRPQYPSSQPDRLAALLDAARKVVRENPAGAASVLQGWVKQAGLAARSR